MWQRSITTNKSITIVPFHWGHPYAADLRDFDKLAFETLPNYRDMLQAFQAEGDAVTALWRGKIIASLGANIMWPGVAEAWLITTTHFDSLAISVTRAANRYFNQLAIEKKLTRLQITVNVDNHLAIRWADALKFTAEGVMRNYGPNGADHVMYSRIYE